MIASGAIIDDFQPRRDFIQETAWANSPCCFAKIHWFLLSYKPGAAGGSISSASSYNLYHIRLLARERLFCFTCDRCDSCVSPDIITLLSALGYHLKERLRFGITSHTPSLSLPAYQSLYPDGVKLASWLCEQQVKFVLRVKQERYIQEESSDYTHLSELGLLPGTSLFLTSVKVTKQKGFGKFNVAGYWRRKYRGKVEDEG